MLEVLFTMILAVVAGSQQNNRAPKQLHDFKYNTMDSMRTITSNSGAPLEDKEATYTLNSNLLSDQHLTETLTRAVSERIPERVVHAPGAGAFGYFETTHDISHICKAKLFSEVGKKTPVAVRFSLTGPRSGTRDTVRETSRGLVVKFYTEEGNLDLPGLNTPCFTFKDPLLFPHLSHAMKPNPTSNLPDPNILWDFLTLHPESMYQSLYLLSGFGCPRSYRHMPAYAIHTYQVYNNLGENYFVRFHLIPTAGIKKHNSTESVKISAGDSNYYARDLYNSIAKGENPRWQLKLQILSEEDVNNADIDVFDVTNTLPVDVYPLHPVGTITLDKNPNNYFSEIEQLAFSPGNLVPGILGAPDKLFEARRFAYREAHLYRLGSNYNSIPVNCPIHSQQFSYNRDGISLISNDERDGSCYYSNSFNDSISCEDKYRPSLIKIHEKKPNNFKQASNFYSNELSTTDKTSLVANIIESVCSCQDFIKRRLVHWLTIIDSGLGNRVAEGLFLNCIS